ncbi:hypothetical protein [Pseudoalteromonas viridis]|uniref:Nuclear transport factor 2 family protein n=1 Tax=Pseudoalteromonas viridis TaxID=339617 RepID=A0ABX7V848_9GAMM|nr:hypothetical protein [Pseudoalteromonas viridis]QTL36675.1 hypothetical protein J5X90_06485 [Pseudoalteromonas viridis]
MNMHEQDLKQIDQLVAELYASISFKVGDKPDLKKMTSLFSTNAQMKNENESQRLEVKPQEFAEIYQEQIDKGAVNCFIESEIWGETQIFGNIAHRFSTYEARFDPDAEEPFCKGVNSIQFTKQQGVWRVVSMIWNDESEQLQIPSQYLCDSV